MEEKEIKKLMPPSDVEAEKAVLGSMMKSADAVADVIDVLKAEDFYLTEHREIFKAMVDMFRRSTPIDLTTVYSELKIKKTADLVGGLTYLSKLMDEAVVFSNAKYYAATVADKARMRQLIHEPRLSGMRHIPKNFRRRTFLIRQSRELWISRIMHRKRIMWISMMS